ncbi:MAG: DUF1214 domain-containing protein [Hyphomicrobiaceae bacterium]|nr:DUF1214 domain-containing protein [Hyphomicrobiaceae bacterium]
MTLPRLTTFLTALMTLGVALATGLGSAIHATGGIGAFGGFESGPWQAPLAVSAEDGNPYVEVALARRGTLPMGPAEGLLLIAETDSAGRLLDAACAYRLEGRMPVSRAFTLAAYRPDGALLSAFGRPSALSGSGLVYGRSGAFLIDAAPEPRAGNWLALSGAGRFVFVARVYDTGLAATLHMSQPPALPEIRRVAGSC